MLRRLSRVLLLCLLLTSLPGVQAQTGLLLPERVNSITSAAYLQDLHWLTTSDGELFTWQRGESEARPLPYKLDSATAILISDGARLYALDIPGSRIVPVTLGPENMTAGEVIPLDLSALSDPYPLASLRNAFILEGKLYLAFSQVFGPNPPSLLVVDLTSAKASPLHIEGLCYATPYREGQLLVTLQAQGMDEQTQLPRSGRLAAYDLGSGTLEDLGELGYPFTGGDFPVAYDPETDAIYIQSPREVRRREPDSSLTLCTYSPFPYQSYMNAGQLPLLPGRQTLLFGATSLVQLSLDPADLPTARLQLRGDLLSDALQSALRRLPHLPVDVTPTDFETLRQLLVTGDSETDIFIIDSGRYDPELIMRKGYSLDLSDKPAFSDFVADCYPFIADFVRRDGRLLMLPLGIRFPALSYEPQTFETFGLPVPQTFDELCALLDGWSPETHPHLLPMVSEGYPAFLTELALSLYADHCDARGLEASFQDDLLKSLLRRVEQTKTGDIPLQMDFAEMSAVLQDMETRLLMRAQDSVSLENLTEFKRYQNGRLPLYLSAAPGEAARAPATLTLAFINPRSQRVEQATTYLEQLLLTLRDQDRIMLQPGYEAMVESQGFAHTMRAYEGFLEAARRSAAEAEEGPLKRELEVEVARQEAQLKEIERVNRYAVDEEGIRRYREIADRAFIRRYNQQYPLRGDEVKQLFKRWLDGQIGLDQCLNEAENRLRLMRLEDN